MEGCPNVLAEVVQSIKLYMSNVSNKKIQMKKKKRKQLISSLNEDNFYGIDEIDYDEIKEVGMTDFERRQMEYAMRESNRFFKKVDKSMGGVILPYNLVVLGSSVTRYIASA